MALEITEPARALDGRRSGAPGPEASILKMRGTEIQQSLTELIPVFIFARPPDPLSEVDRCDTA